MAIAPERTDEAPPRTQPQVHRLGGRSWLLVGAVIIAVVELALAVSKTSFYARIGWKNLHAPKQLVRDADVDPFAYYDPTLPMVVAGQAIPRTATYTIVVGHERNAMVPGLAIDVYRLWLAPRRYTTDIHKAQWALTYWKSSEFLGVPYTTEIGLGPGVNAVKLGGPKR
jgi:hypothetical protein